MDKVEASIEIYSYPLQIISLLYLIALVVFSICISDFDIYYVLHLWRNCSVAASVWSILCAYFIIGLSHILIYGRFCRTLNDRLYTGFNKLHAKDR